MQKWIAFLSLILAQSTQAAMFECQSFLNLDNTASRIVETKMDEKISAVRSDEATAYLTEKSGDRYILEVFIPESEMRIYAEGSVVQKEQTLTASAWTRAYIIDVTCRKMN